MTANGSSSLLINRPCPKCKSLNTVTIQHNTIYCSSESCRFTHSFSCPICSHSITKSQFTDNGEFKCIGCNSQISIKKIKYLIENSLQIDHHTCCSVCHGPTIHHPSMNLSHRCFYFPACSGQTNLFGENETESLVFLDFETTGLEIGKDYIIEIGAIKIDKEGYEHTFQQFVKPPIELPDHITKITGITNDMVIDSHPINLVIEHLLNFIENSTIVVHNADFDIPWLIISLLRNQFKYPENKIVCTLEWAQQNQEGRSSLGALSKKYGIQHANAHRALADTAVTKELYFIFNNLKKTPRPEKNIHSYQSICDRILAQP